MPGRGLKRSTPHRVAHRLGAERHPEIAAALAQPLPADGQIVPAPRADQGGTELCAEHSCLGCVVCVRGGQPGSPLLLASCTYADERARETPIGQPLPVLADTGAELQDVADALRRWGIGPMGPQIPGRSGWSDAADDVPGAPFPEPNVAALEVAGHTLIAGEYSIPVDSGAPRMVAASIVAGFPVWLGTSVGQAFQNLQSGQVAQPTPADDATQGGHAMFIAGYRTNSVGKYEFWVINSWGTGWCEDGTCWASTEWLMACWELWPWVGVARS